MAKTILHVDDAQTILMFAKFLLDKGGYNVLQAASGQQALDTIKADYSGIDMVVMDYQMAEMNGAEATRALRQYEATLGGKNRNLPVIMATARGEENVRKDCTAAGCTDFVTKPLIPKEFMRVVDQYFQK